MPVNPNIAMGVRGIELQNPLAQYGQIAAIQNAQNQNALAQFQLTGAQREQESINALNQAYQSAYNPQTGEIDINALRKTLSTGGFGSKLPGLEKSLGELQKQKLETEKLKGEVTAQPTKLAAEQTNLVDAKLKQSRQFLENVTTPEQYIAWHESNHKDPILGPMLAARGVTADQARGRIMQAIQQGPAAFAQLINESKLGTEKFMELNKPTTSVVNRSGQSDIVQTPGLGGTPVTAGSYADVPLPANVEAQRSRIARAGATNLNVNTEKTYGSKFGGLIAESDAAKLSAAENAPRMAENADRIADLLATGKVITGTGANARLQLAKALNLAGGTDSERIRNTEVLVSSLAETTLGAIKASNLGAGQGFTNADRDFLEKAVAGQLSYDQKSLGELARLSRRAAEKSAEAWNKRAPSIPKSALEGTGYSTEPVVIPPRQQKAAGANPAPTGVDQALWNVMTPEERKLWQK